MARFGKNNSSSVAKERLKLLLIHDRAGTSPSSGVLEMVKKDMIAVISKYFDVYEDGLEVEIRNSSDASGSGETRLSANIPIRSIKNIGRNMH